MKCKNEEEIEYENENKIQIRNLHENPRIKKKEARVYCIENSVTQGNFWTNGERILKVSPSTKDSSNQGLRHRQ